MHWISHREIANLRRFVSTTVRALVSKSELPAHAGLNPGRANAALRPSEVDKLSTTQWGNNGKHNNQCNHAIMRPDTCRLWCLTNAK